MEALTTSWRPLWRAMREIISSAALPNVALSKPPMPGPVRSARCSVALPIYPARGTMAPAEAAKTSTGLACSSSRTRPSGMNPSKRLRGSTQKCPRRMPMSSVVPLLRQLLVELKGQGDICPARHRPPLLGYGRMLPGFSSLLGCSIEDLMTRRARYLDVTDRAIGAQFQMQRDCPFPALLACHLRVGWRRLVHEARSLPTLARGRIGEQSQRLTRGLIHESSDGQPLGCLIVP